MTVSNLLETVIERLKIDYESEYHYGVSYIMTFMAILFGVFISILPPLIGSPNPYNFITKFIIYSVVVSGLLVFLIFSHYSPIFNVRRIEHLLNDLFHLKISYNYGNKLNKLELRFLKQFVPLKLNYKKIKRLSELTSNKR